MKPTTQSKVLLVLKTHFGMPDNEVKLTDAIVDDLGADSLDTIEIVMALEEEFDIEINESDLIERCEVFNVQNAIDMIDDLIVTQR